MIQIFSTVLLTSHMQEGLDINNNILEDTDRRIEETIIPGDAEAVPRIISPLHRLIIFTVKKELYIERITVKHLGSRATFSSFD